MRTISVLCVLLVGCGTGLRSNDDNEDLGEWDEGEFPDPFAQTAPDPACDSFEDNPIPGATGFYIGDFVLGGEDQQIVSGTEHWVLHANPNWSQVTTDSCEVVWGITGTKAEPVTCTTCDYAVSLTAIIDTDRSTCPQDLITASPATFDVTYDVRVISGGSTEFYFDSGNVLGGGFTDGQRLTYVSTGDCNWF